MLCHLQRFGCFYGFTPVIFSKLCFNSRKFSNSYKATMGERYAANVIDQPGVSNNSLNSYGLCHMWMVNVFFFLF